MRPKLVAITVIGSRLILVISSPGELADLGHVQAERVDLGGEMARRAARITT